MPVLEITGLSFGAIALATLFTTCIECFDYVRAAQAFGPDFETVLAKLDLEKTRLLIWGNSIGILQPAAKDRNPALQDEHIIGSILTCLKQIEDLLSNAEKLRRHYGMQVANHKDTPALKNLLSANSMAIFKTSCLRLFAQLSNNSDRPSLKARTKWAIYDKAKFQGLLNDLKHFIDGLNLIVPVDRATQDRIVMADIESILDLDRLRLVQEAAEDSYPVWSSRASEVIEASELGTMDRRDFEERIRDMQDAPITSAARAHSERGDLPKSDLTGERLPNTTPFTRLTKQQP
jgi:Prion-inhibition and propagation